MMLVLDSATFSLDSARLGSNSLKSGWIFLSSAKIRWRSTTLHPPPLLHARSDLTCSGCRLVIGLHFFHPIWASWVAAWSQIQSAQPMDNPTQEILANQSIIFLFGVHFQIQWAFAQNLFHLVKHLVNKFSCLQINIIKISNVAYMYKTELGTLHVLVFGRQIWYL